ncbi:MAG: ral secretion pathway protein [Patescibacteria group bacterium]|nr:ral secretion pathway protein [Patescibacteria group bacterium]
MKLTSQIKLRRQQQGFTLIEVLLVVAIIAILAGIVILAINPNKQLGDTRNSQRQADVNTILNAAYQYSIDNQGNIPTTITTTATDICATGAASCTGLVDLSVLSTNGKYLVALPKDPQTGDATNTGYQISQNANGRITVAAPDAEQGKTISATR